MNLADLGSATRRSAQTFPSPDGGAVSSPAYALINIASFADSIPPWGSSVRARDILLREFAVTEPWVESTISSLSARNAAFEWALDGPPETVRQVHRMLNLAHFGHGWVHLVQKLSADLYGQDNGAFMEIIRDGPDPTAPVIGIAHLDSARCTRTGNPRFPVVYEDRNGARHKLAWHQVVDITDNASPIETMNGVQVCAVSRALRYSQVIRDIATMEHEKVSGRFTGALHVVSGVSNQMIEDALGTANEEADNRGRSRYQLPTILATLDPTAEVKVATLLLRSLPDGWNPDVDKRWYIAVLALAFGCEYQDLAPLPGGNLGTSQQSTVLHLKAGGKGPKVFMKIIQHMLNYFVLPQTVTFRFTDADLQMESVHSEIQKRRAETLQIYASTGALTPEVLQQMMADDGILRPEYLEMLRVSDATPDVGRMQSDAQLLRRRGTSNVNVGGATTSRGAIRLPSKELTDEDWYGVERQRLMDEYAAEMEAVLSDISRQVSARIRQDIIPEEAKPQ